MRLLSLVLAVFVSLPLYGTNCRKDVAKRGGGGMVPQSFSRVAREMGLRYLMFHVNLKDFSSLVEASQRGSGKLELAIRRDRYYDQTLMPLSVHQSGKWANYIICGGGDSIGMGVRSKGTFEWEVGFLLPLELLDEVPFSIHLRHTVRDRQRAMMGIPNGYALDPKQASAEDFAAVLAEAMEDPYPHSTDAMEHFRIQFTKTVPLSRTQIIWFPLPAMAWVATHPDVFSSLASSTKGFDWYYGLPNAIPPVHMRIAIKNGNDWIHPPPPGPREGEGFDPKRRIGTWYTTVPDWDSLAQYDTRLEGYEPPKLLLGAPPLP